MDSMVSARVPVEVKKQGDAILKRMGFSVTALINAAYSYLIANKELPGSSSPLPTTQKSGETRKTLKGKEASTFCETWSRRAVLDAPEYDGTNFKELLDEARGDRFARFA